MKGNYTVNGFKKPNRGLSGLFVLISLVSLGFAGFAQTTYSFTNAGATGRFGPSQAQVNAAYAMTNLAGQVTVVGGIQQWTVPSSGSYIIRALGAQGGTEGQPGGGLGADMSGEFNLTAGQVIRILVGQKGGDGFNYGAYDGGGGGGGSFVTDINNVPLVVAGGGGGKTDPFPNGPPTANNAFTTTSGGSTNSGGGGTNGNGGNNGITNGQAAGGGGLLTDGVSNGVTGGQAFVNGGVGGDASPNSGGYNGGDGGFGGGGAGWHNSLNRCGGGGGYSGGQGGTWSPSSPDMLGHGGGGGSFNAGINQINVGGINTGHGAVYITRLCNVGVAASANPVCFGDQVTLTTDAVSNISWSEGGQTASSIVVNPSVTTTYSVTGTSTANCITTAMITVSVNPLPLISTMSSPSVVCVGDPAYLSATGANTYVWSGGGATGANVTVNPSATGVYTVTGTSVAGCVNTQTVLVTVNTNSLTVSPNTAICTGGSAVLNVSGANTYSWSNGSLFNIATVNPTVTTSYTVNGTDVHNCALSGVVSVAVNSLPNVSAAPSKQTICKGEAVTLTGTGATTYTWNNGDTGSQVTYTLTVDVPHYYSVTGVDANGCSNTASTSVMVSKCTGLTEQSALSAVMVYPNPGTGVFMVSGVAGKDHTLKVYNGLGSLVRSQLAGEGLNQLDLSTEANGIYFIYLSGPSGEIQLSKVIKE